MGLFQAGGELKPDSKAFDPRIHLKTPEARVLPTTMIRKFHPHVIGGPLLAGKTTQVNSVCTVHQRFSPKNLVGRVFCQLPRERKGISEAELRELLAARLVARPNGSLADILASSAVLRNAKAPQIIAVVNSESLSLSAIRWLLAGFRGAQQRPALINQLRVQLLVDGSFAIETLTVGPNSEYPLPQSFPPEFSCKEQSEFLGSRLEQIGFRISKAVAQELWQYTAGDKYLTQVVGKVLAQQGNGRRGRTRLNVPAQDVRRILESPVHWPDLYRPATQAIGRLVTLVENDDFRFRGFLRKLKADWSDVSVSAKAIAYEGGLVRRVGETAAIPRTPHLEGLFDAAIGRAYDALAFTRLGFSTSSLDPDDSARATATVREILRYAASSQLVAVHVGFGSVTGSGTVRMSASTLDGARYEGSWSVPTRGYQSGTKVWGLMWAFDDQLAGKRATQVQLYRIPAIPLTPKRL